MWSILALGAAERLVNRVIDLDAITRIQLNALYGQRLRVIIDQPQLSVDVFFDEQKLRLEPTPTGQAQQSSIFEQRPFDQANTSTTADTILHVPNVVELIKLLISDDMGTVPIQGDYRLLMQIQQIMANASPDLAAHLSPWIGAKAAHEIGKLQQLPKLAKRTVQSQLFFAQDYIKEDTGLFAPRWQMDELQQSTRTLNQNLDRLDAKIQALQSKLTLG